MNEHPLQGSGPVNPCNPANPLFANGTIDKFEATANAGHQVATGKEHGVHQIVRTHLAF